MNEQELRDLFAEADDAQKATEIVLDHFDDRDVVRYGIANYEIDVEFIIDTLGGQRDGIDTADVMLFNIARGEAEDDDAELSGDNPDYLEE